MRIAGIDPGLSGAIFVIDTHSQHFSLRTFRGQKSVLDINELDDNFNLTFIDHVFIEKPFLNGLEGGQSAMTIGSNYGRLTALLDLNHVGYTEVPPRVWQSALSLKGGSRAIVKQNALNLAVQAFSRDIFIVGRARNPHQGLVDAACIALYGVAEWNKQTSTESMANSAPSLETQAKSSSTSKSKKSLPKKSSPKRQRK